MTEKFSNTEEGKKLLEEFNLRTHYQKKKFSRLLNEGFKAGQESKEDYIKTLCKNWEEHEEIHIKDEVEQSRQDERKKVLEEVLEDVITIIHRNSVPEGMGHYGAFISDENWVKIRTEIRALKKRR